MSESNTLTGNESFLTLVNESSWGDYPGSPTLIHCPCDVYDVEMVNEVRNANPFTGFRQRQHGRAFRGMPSGNLNAPLYAWRQSGQTISLAEYLLVWAFGSPEAKHRSSKSANWYEGLNVSNQRHRGLRVNQATLAGQEGGDIMLQLALMGKDQDGNATVGNAPAVPYDRKKLIAFEFGPDVTLSVDGEEVLFGGFSLQTQHALAVEYLNSRRPSSLKAGDTTNTVTLNPPKSSNKWDEMIRDMDLEVENREVPVVLTLQGLHMGTGAVDTSWTEIEISLGRCMLRGAKTARSRGLLQQPLEFDIYKPQEDGVNDIMLTFTDIA